jgi:hypothetical protein
MDIQRRREQFRLSQIGRRKRKRDGLKLYDIPVNTELLIDALVRKGYLPDGHGHTHQEIECALAIAVDEIFCQR